MIAAHRFALLALMAACGASTDPEAPIAQCLSRCGPGVMTTLTVRTLGQGGEEGLSSVVDLSLRPEDGQMWVLLGDRVIPLERQGGLLARSAGEAIVLPSAAEAIAWYGDTLYYAGAEGLGVVRWVSDRWQIEEPKGAAASGLEVSASGLAVVRGGAVERDGSSEATGLMTITDLSHDGAAAVSREESAMALRVSDTWQRFEASAAGFEVLADVQAVDRRGTLVLVGARGLHRFGVGETVEPLGSVTLPAPWGVAHGWDDEQPATVHDVAFAGDKSVYAATVYGGYLLRWTVDGEMLVSGEVVAVQPRFTDDDYEEDSLGVAIGFDPTESARLARLEPEGQGAWVASALWRYVGHSDGARLQQGQGGLESLGGAYSAVVSPDGRHLYTGAWNAAEPGVWVIGDEAALEPGPVVAGAPGRPINYGTPDVAIAGDGQQVYAIDDQFNRLHVYERDVDTGALTWRSTVGEGLALELLVGVAASGDGAVWACDFEASALVAFARDDSGEMRVSELFVDGQAGVDGLHGAEDPVPSPDGRHLYVVSYRGAAVARFDRGVPGSPSFVEAWRPEGPSDRLFGIEAGAFTAGGERLVLVSPVTDRIFVAARAEDGALSLLSDYSIAALNPGPALADNNANPGRVAITPSGAVVVSLRRWDAVALLRLGEGGELTWTHTWADPAVEASVRRWPNGVAVAPSGEAAWVTTALGDSLLTLRIFDQASGSEDGCGGVCP